MCGGTSNYRTASLCVGWSNVVLSVLVVIYYTYDFLAVEQKPEENAESEEMLESDFQPIFHHGVILHNILGSAVSVLLCFVPSILLLKGIKQKRRKLVAPWLYIAYVSVAINSIYLIFLIWGSTSFTGRLGIDLIKYLPFSLGLIFSILCIYPDRKLYKILSIPPPIQPTQCDMESKKTEDHLRYVPVFDN